MLAVAADLLTFSRLIAAGIMLWLGLQGPQTLRWAILVAVLAWTTDQLDGWAARRANSPTHLAPADFAIDTVLYAATLGYLVLAGFVPAAPAIAFVVLALDPVVDLPPQSRRNSVRAADRPSVRRDHLQVCAADRCAAGGVGGGSRRPLSPPGDGTCAASGGRTRAFGELGR